MGGEMCSKVKYNTGHWAHYWSVSKEGMHCKIHSRWPAHAMAAVPGAGRTTVPWLSLTRWHNDKLRQGG